MNQDHLNACRKPPSGPFFASRPALTDEVLDALARANGSRLIRRSNHKPRAQRPESSRAQRPDSARSQRPERSAAPQAPYP